MSEYLKMPWSEEVTVENLKSAKEIIKNLVSNVNLDGMGEEDAEEVEFDFNRAIEALEKQITKKPEKALISYCGNTIKEPVCPVCGYNLIPIYYIGGGNKEISYCKNCGQAIDWGDEE